MDKPRASCRWQCSGWATWYSGLYIFPWRSTTASIKAFWKITNKEIIVTWQIMSQGTGSLLPSASPFGVLLSENLIFRFFLCLRAFRSISSKNESYLRVYRGIWIWGHRRVVSALPLDSVSQCIKNELKFWTSNSILSNPWNTEWKIFKCPESLGKRIFFLFWPNQSWTLVCW